MHLLPLNRLKKRVLRNNTTAWLLSSVLGYLIINAILRLWILGGFLSYLPDRILNPVYAFGFHVIPGAFGEILSLSLLLLVLAIPGVLGAKKISSLLMVSSVILTIAGLHYFMYAVDWFTPQDLRLTGGVSFESSLDLISGSFSIPIIAIQLFSGATGFLLLQSLFFRRLTNVPHSLRTRNDSFRNVTYLLATLLTLSVLYLILPVSWYHKCAINPVIHFAERIIPDNTPPLNIAEVQFAAQEAGFPDCLSSSDQYSWTRSNDPLLRKPNMRPHAQSHEYRHPNIFIFVLESLAFQILEHKSLARTSFQKFRSESVEFSYFFANGFPTADGHEALLYSVFPPLIDGYNFRQHQMISLAHILKKNGFATQAYLCSQHESAKQYRFFEKAGFGKIYDTHFFNIPEKGDTAAETILLSAMVSNASAWPNSRPVMMFFSSAIGHSPFKYYPKNSSVEKVIKNATTLEERYLNQINFILESVATTILSIRRTEAGANAIFIITGDHAPHAKLAYEKIGLPRIDPKMEFAERHRTPFILHFSAATSPAREVTQRIGGQIDIAPTILHLAGIHEGETRFFGRSLFSSNWQNDRLLLLNKKHAVSGKCLINEDTRNLAGNIPSDGKAQQLHERVQKLRKFMSLYRKFLQETLSTPSRRYSGTAQE